MVGRSRARSTYYVARGVLAAGIAVALSTAAVVPPVQAQTGQVPSDTLGGSGGSSGPAVSSSSDVPRPGEPEGPYVGGVEVVSGSAEDPGTLTGRVFHDVDRDSRLDVGESGVSGVSVSNGLDVVKTDAEGRYRLPARGNFTAFVTQPAGWQVPVDAQNFAQFSFNHYPQGSPAFRYPGVSPTGALPAAVNFPLTLWRATAAPQQNCVFAADTQPENMREMEFARAGVVADLKARQDYRSCGVLLLGDNVENDLSLNAALKESYAGMNGPVRALPGNHDLNFDSPGPENSADTFRREFGAPYFSYDIGEAHIVALFNIHYYGATDDGGYGGYTQAISDEQLRWLENDLATVDRDAPVVVATHAPLVNYREVVTENADELYEILEEFPNAVTVSGHAHTVENFLAGESRPEWTEGGLDRLPRDQIVAGAVAGSWYSGALNSNGVPFAYTSEGAEPGALTMQFNGTQRSEYYTVRNEPRSKQTLTGVYSPSWDTWARAAQVWSRDPDSGAEPPEPFNTAALTLDDVRSGRSAVATSFYAGSTAAKVTFSLDGGHSTPGTLNQGPTERLKVGWQHSEVVSTTHHLLHRGTANFSSPHLYRFPLPRELAMGPHVVDIAATDRYGVVSTERFEFTVLAAPGPAPEAVVDPAPEG